MTIPKTGRRRSGTKAWLTSKSRQPRASYRPMLESLEDRVVPTTLSIPTNLTGARGSIVTVPINVDVLQDQATGFAGFGYGDFVLAYNTSFFTVVDADVHLGSVDPQSLGFSLHSNTQTAGLVIVNVSGSAGQPSTAGGSVVSIDFHINANAPNGPTAINLRAKSPDSSTATRIGDPNINDYDLTPPPQDVAGDPSDGLVNIGVLNQAPIAADDAYRATERESADAANLTVSAPSILANDTDQDGDALTAIKLSDPAHGTVTFQADGSFVYSSMAGYVGPDSFTYAAFDGANNSNTATVSVSVTPRLNIPTNLTAVAGGTVVVPVNIDDAAPPGSGGLIGVTLAVNYDPAVFSVTSTDVVQGTATRKTNAVQTISFGGTVTGGSFTLALTNNSATVTSSPITYSSSQAVLQNNIQTAINGLSNMISGSAVASTASANTFTVTFQGASVSGRNIATMSANASLTGTNPSVAVATTTNGFAAWTLSATIAQSLGVGKMGISMSGVSGINSNPGGGSLVLITFHVNGSAPVGLSPINLVATTAPIVGTVTTRLDAQSGQLPLRPLVTNGLDPDVDGVVNIIPSATHFSISGAPGSTTAGSSTNFIVTALDASNSSVAGYTGTVHFSSSDSQAGLPANATLTNGAGTFSVTLKTAGNQTLKASDVANSSITGSSGTIAVVAAQASHFGVSASPGTVTTGNTASVSVTALDSFNNTAAGYAGSVHFSSTDAVATLPADSSLTNGLGAFSVTLKSSGFATVAATDSTNSNLAGTSNTVTVVGHEATHFSIGATPASITAGSAISVTVTALDAGNATAGGYSGTIHFSSSDPLAGLPTNATLVSGSGTFSVSLKTAANQTVSATDISNTTLTATSPNITVIAGSATHFGVAAPNNVVAGTAFAFAITALDAFNNSTSGYTGTIHFDSGDSQKSLPPDAVLTSGTGSFSAILRTAGSQTLTASDATSGNPSGTSNTVTVIATAASHFAIASPANVKTGNAFDFTVAALDRFNNTAVGYTGTVHFSSADTTAILPADNALTSGLGTFAATMKTAGSKAIHASDAVISLIQAVGSPLSVPDEPEHVAIADLNGDGKLDIVAPSLNANVITVFLGIGNGTFAAGVGYAVGNSPEGVAVADFNGDGKLDLVTASNNASILLGNGDGTFHPASTIAIGTMPIQVVTADFNGDGKVDLAFSVISVGVAVVFGNGDGTFGSPTNYSVGGTAPEWLAVGDFNRDGKKDLAIAVATTNKVAVLLCNVNGSFLSAVTYGVGNSPDGIVVGDFDGDGIQDVAASNINSSTISVLVGKGDGTFKAATNYGANGALTVAAADLNGDGKLDLVASNFGSNTVTILQGNPNGTFGAGHSYPAGVQPVAAAAGDFNADGALDLAVANQFTRGVTVLLNATPTGNFTITASQSAATHFVLSTPSTVTAGDSFSITVTAVDDSNATATGYAGTIHFTSSDGQSTLPADGTLSNGQGIFTVTLKSAGTQSLDATDTTSPSIIGTSGNLTVNAIVATHFKVTAPASAGTGSIGFTVTALDHHNNPVPSYSGTIFFASNDSQAGLPTNATLTSGTGSFNATLKTPGNSTLSVTDTLVSTVAGTSNTIAVSAIATRFIVAAPVAVNADSFFTTTATAVDVFGNTATGYAGTVRIGSSDASAHLPANHTFVNGVGVFGVTLQTVGTQTLTATDVVASSIGGTSNSIAISSSKASHFSVAAAASAPQGVPISFTVTALDVQNIPVSNYSGTVHFVSSDPLAVFPANATLTNGVGTFTAVLNTSGSQTLIAADSSIIASYVQAQASPITVGGFPSDVYVADFNNDGTLDLAVTNNTSSSVSVLLNNGLGAFSLAGTYSVAFTAQGIDGGDFNGDGKLDLVVGCGHQFVSILYGNGNGSFQPSSDFSLNSGNHVAVGDFNSDGKADLAVAGYAGDFSGILRILPGNGSGSFATGTSYTLNSPYQIVTGYFNNDNKLDLAIANHGTSKVLIFFGNGDATFTPALNSPVVSGLSAITTGDFNGDGVTDIAAASDTFNYVTILLGSISGDGTFSAPCYAATDYPSGQIKAADFNKDGALDLLSANLGVGVNSMSVMLGNGDGSFGGNQIFSVGTQPYAVATADFNGDSIPDLVAADQGSNDVTILLNQALGVNGSATVAVNQPGTTHFAIVAPSSATAGAAFSFNVAALNASNQTVTGYTGLVHFSSSDGKAVLPAEATLSGGVGTFSATLLTAGGQTITANDIASSNISGTTNTVSVNSAAATHFSIGGIPSNIAAGTSFPFVVTAQDKYNNTVTGFNGTVHIGSTDSQAVLPSNPALTGGLGTFFATLKTAGNQSLSAANPVTGATFVQAPGPLINAGNQAGAFVVADFDGDGKPDLAIASNGNNTVTVLPGAGDGTFHPGTASFVGARPSGIFAGDFNGDGKQDIAFVSYGGNALGAVLGNGDGTFGPTSTFLLCPGDNSGSFLTGGDFNGDGILDIAVTCVNWNTDSGVVTILLGNGNGSFQSAVHYDAGGYPAGILVADLNHDGKLDIVVANNTGNTIGVLLGRGNGTFNPAVDFAAGSEPVNPAVGDFNGDGNLDIAVTNHQDNSLSVLLGRGDGTFNAQTKYATGAGPNGLVVSDVNHDGLLDMVVTSSANSALSVFYGNGDGTFASFQSIAALAGIGGVAAASFNGDAFLDLAVFNGANLEVLLGQASAGSSTVSVAAAAANHFVVIGSPATLTFGGTANFNVTALDQFNNTATAYNGTVGFTSTDGAATMPANSSLTSGSGVFSITLKTAGNRTVTVTDTANSAIVGTSNTITVAPPPATHFAIITPTATTAGTSFTFIVTALDASNNTAAGYSGTFQFTTTDIAATMPANATLTSGSGTFTVSLKTTGTRTLTVTDTANTSIAGTSNSITVVPGAATHFVLNAPASAVAGTAFNFIVSALDANNNTAIGYGGSVRFTSSDGSAALPGISTLTSGTGSFAATLVQANLRTLTATDTANSGSGGTSNNIAVAPGAATHFGVTIPSNVALGSTFSFTVAALDRYNNTAVGYGGTVHFSSSDSQAVLPAASTLTNGIGTFTGTFKTSGSQTISVAADFLQAPGSPLGLSGSPSWMAVGDLNGDGKSDIAVVRTNDSSVSALLSNGDGTFQAVRTAVGFGPQFVNTGDFNGDHVLDLVVVNTLTNGVSVLLGHGDGTFGPISAYQVSPPSSFANYNAVGDFNGDGKLDLAVTSYSNSSSNAYINIFKGNGDGTLSLTTTYSVGKRFAGLVAVDFNHDNKLDLAADDFSDSSVDVFQGNGDGTFGTAVKYAVANAQGGVPAIGDFNSDGNPDIAVTTVGGGTVDVLLGHIDGTFANAISYPVGGLPYGLRAADLTGDGKLDLIFVDNTNNIVSILPGNGDGTFGSRQDMPGNGGPRNVAVGDWNGDEGLDFAVSNDSNVVSIMLAPPLAGSATITLAPLQANHFTAATPNNVVAGVGLAATVTALDIFNNTATAYGGTVHFTSNDGQAALPADATLTSGIGSFTVTLKTAGSRTITAADVASSSITGTSTAITVSPSAATHVAITAPASVTLITPFSITVSVLDQFNNTVTAYAGTLRYTSSDTNGLLPANATLTNGTGSFSVTLKTAGNQTLTAADLLNSTLVAASNTIFVDNPATHFAVAAPPNATAGSQVNLTVTALDANNGRATGFSGTVTFTSSDTAAMLPINTTLTSGIGTFSVTFKTAGSQTINARWPGSNTASFQSAGSPITVGNDPQYEVAGDFNNDGRLDIAAANLAGGTITVLLGHGDGTFNVGGSYPVGLSPLDVATGDFNGDGKLDLVAGTGGGTGVSVLLGIGNGSFGAPSIYNFASTAMQTRGVAVADFNGDGKLDLAAACENTGSVSDTLVAILIGKGDGTFGSATNIATGTPRPEGIVAADFNHDGKMDLAEANSGAANVTVQLGNGDGSFGMIALYAVGTTPIAVAAADFNGDSNLDLVTTNEQSGNVSVLIGNGNGTFKPAVSYAAGTDPLGLALVDVNADGKLDIVATNYDSTTIAVFLGSGDGTFAPRQSITVGNMPHDVAAGDFNGDFLPDLAVVNQNANAVTVLLNTNKSGAAIVTVSAAAATHFAIYAPTGSPAGIGSNVTVAALDAFNNTATNFAGTVHLTSSDSAATLPANSLLTSGLGTFSVTLKTVGMQTITASDAVNAGTTEASAVITVGPPPQLGDRVWNDSNGNGLQDAGEPGVAGAVVELFGSTNAVIGDGDDVSLGIQITDANGLYHFNGPPVFANYYLVFRAPIGFGFTLQDANSNANDTIDSDANATTGRTGLFTLASNNLTLDAGLTGNAPAFGFGVDLGGASGNSDYAYGTATDAAGNVYVVGQFQGTIDFDRGSGVYNLVCAGNYDIFVAKYTSVGALAWAKRFGGSTNESVVETGSAIAVDGAGDVYTTGVFSTSNADFDPGSGTYIMSSAGQSDTFVSKLDSNGNFVWAKQIGGSSYDVGQGIAVDSAGNVFTTGYFFSTDADFDPGSGAYQMASAGGADIFVSKFDSSGNFVWAKQMGNGGDERAAGVTLDSTGNVYTTGAFSSTNADFDPGSGVSTLTSVGAADVFVSKLDNNGNFVWAKRLGGTGDDDGAGIAVDGAGNVFTTGNFISTNADFDPGSGTFTLANAGSQDIFVSKLDSGGNFVWAKNLGGSNLDVGYGIAVDSASNVYTTGYFNATADFDPGSGTSTLTTTGFQDAFVSKLDSGGNFVWAKDLGGSKSEFGKGIAVDGVGNLFTVGYFNSPDIDFDPSSGAFTLGATGANDAFISKLAANTTPTGFTVTATPTSITAGAAFTFTVTAIDATNSIVLGYNGTVHLTSTDPLAVLPSDATLTKGAGTFTVTLKTAGNRTLTAADTVHTNAIGTSNAITVVAAAATHLAVSIPASATAGVGFGFAVTALDQFNNTAMGYGGILRLTSSDAQSSLPANATLTSGTGSFNVTLKTAGNQTLTATDTSDTSLTATTATTFITDPATHFSATASANATAGSAFTVTVSALNLFNAPAASYNGTVRFTSSDVLAVLPANATLTNGIGTFSVMLKSAGAKTLTIADTVSTTILGATNLITVAAGAATRFAASSPANATAGAAFNVTVTAFDAFNNTAVGYGGSVQFSSSDAAAALPANNSLTSGVGIFSVTLNTGGSQFLMASDATNTSINGSSAILVYNPATHFAVSAPASTTAGSSISFTVTALDLNNAPTVAYNGTVHFTSSDGLAVLPANATLTNGARTFTATLKTAGAQTLTAVDTTASNISGTSTSITVSSAAPNHIAASAPASTTAGNTFSVVVTVQDQFNNITPGYTGTVRFTSTDSQAVLPPNQTLTSGAGAFNVILKTASNRTVTVSDVAATSITAFASTLIVTPAATSHFAVGAPTIATAGTAFGVAVTALDPFNNTAIGYGGTVKISTGDVQAVLPADGTLTSGVGNFSVSLKTGGNLTVTATDAVNSGITGVTGTITVRNPATHFGVSAVNAATAGTAFNFSVTALDVNNNATLAYSGTIHFTSSDTQAVLPANATLSSGVGNFTAALKMAGSRTLTAADTLTSSIAGTGTITINAASATHLAIGGAPAIITAGTPFTFAVTALDPFNNTATGFSQSVRFTSSDSQAVLPANSSLTSGVGSFTATLKTAAGAVLSATALDVGSVSFVQGPGSPIAVGSNPQGAAIGDVNNDGNLDIAVANVGSNTVSILLGNGAGAFSPGGIYPVGFSPVAVIAADLNSDGRLDVATVNQAGWSVSVLINRGDGTFNAAVDYVLGGAGLGLTVADLNNDGKLDLAAPFMDGNNSCVAGILVNKGDGTFKPVTKYLLGKQCEGIAAGDFNHDGNQDLAVAATADRTVSVLIGNGDGTFQAVTRYAAGNFPVQVVIGDFDKDGHFDVAATNLAGDSVSVLLGNGDGTFKPATNIAESTQPYGLAAADFNGDGKLDLVVTNAASHDGCVLLGNGDGSFTNGPKFAISVDPIAVSVGDMNNDGTLDLVVVDYQANKISVLLHPAIVGNATVAVTPAAVNRFAVFGSPVATAGNNVGVTVAALDPFNNTVTNYAGTVNFSCSDSQAVLGANQTTLTSGQGTFGVTFKTAGSQTLTAADATNSNVTGSSATAVNPAAATRFTVSAPALAGAGSTFSVTVTARDTFGNIAANYIGTVRFTKTDSGAGAVVPTNYAFVSGDHGVHTFTNGFTLVSAGAQTITATDTATSSISGAATVNVGVTLSIPSNLTGGRGNITTVPLNVNLLSDPVNGNAGLSGGDFIVYYDPSLFTVADSDVHLGSILTPASAWGLLANTSLPGQIVIGLSGSGTNNTTVGGSLVTVDFHVKSTAPIGAVSALDLAADLSGGLPLTHVADQNAQDYVLTPPPLDGPDPNDGSISIVNQAPIAAGDLYAVTERAVAGDPILVVASTGVLANDTDPDGQPITASKVSNPGHGTLAFNSDGSFTYTPDLGYQGADSFSYKASDGSLFSNTVTVNLNVTPRLSIPTNLSGIPGGTVVVPVIIDNPNPNGSGGLDAATLAVNFDPSVFTVDSGDVQTGTVTNNWLLTTDINAAAGQIGIHLSSATPNTSVSAGSLAFITLHIKASTPGGNTAINLAATNAANGGTVTTSLHTALGGLLDLRPAVTNTANDVGVDGAVTIVGATHFVISAPASATAGSTFSVTVTALDQFNATAAGYSGTVHFTSNDSQASMPADATLTNGAGTFNASLKTVGTRTITATDTVNGVIGICGGIAVSAAAATHFTVTAPTSVTFGNAFNFTVIAKDDFNNTAAGYSGTVHFTSSDSQASLPADAVLSGGVGTLSATLKSSGTQTLTATDTAATSISGTSNNISPAATHFVISVPTATTAGDAFVIMISAQDQFGVTTAGYAGTVHFSSSDAKAWLPADVTLSNGVGFFATILKTAGNQSLAAVDKINSALSGTTGAIVVSPAAVNHFGFTVPATAATGVPFNFSVTALDPYNNVLTGYSGAIHFMSNDGAATVPADATLTNGAGTFTATLRTVGSQLLLATDTVTTSITGASGLITTRGLMVSGVTPTPLGFVASFNKAFDPSVLNLYDGVGTYGASDVTVIGPSGLVRGSLLLNTDNKSFTFIKTGVGTAGLFAGVLAAGNYTVTFRSAANGFRDTDGGLLDGNGDGVSGDNYTTTFTVGATSQPVLSIPDFARGPYGAVNIKVPQLNGSGIPITLTMTTGVTDVTFKLNYNPALLTISNTLSNTSGTFTLVGTPTGGVANFTFHSNTALNGNVTLGQIVAQVPDSAASSYKAKELLHLSNIVLNGNITTTINDDGVHVAAYPGDVSGDGLISPLDASLTSRVATIFDTGFAAYRLADPAIVGDLNGNSFTDSSDVTLINRTLAGITVAQLPPLPTGLTVVPTGPDPTLSLPTDLNAAPGETVVVPVYMDTARPEGSTGLMEAVLALRFDPKVFTISSDDVHLGTLPSLGTGWRLQSIVNAQTGEIGIDLFSPTPIMSAGGGSLVTLTLHVLQSAPAGASGINLVRTVNPTGQRTFVTTASDAAGPFILHPAVTDHGDPGVDGMVSVLGTSRMLMQARSAPSLAFDDPNTEAETATALPPALAGNLAPRRELVDRIFADLDVARAVSATPEWTSLDSLGDSAFEGAPSITYDLMVASPTANESPWDTAAEGYFAKLGLADNRARKASKNGNAYGFEPSGDSFDLES